MNQRSEPSPDELRRAASELESLASDTDRSAGNLAGLASSVRPLPGQVQNAIQGTATKIDRSMLQDLDTSARSLATAIAALEQAGRQARGAAESARQQATQIEQAEAAEKARQRQQRR